MARSLLLAGQVEDARAAAEQSIDICDRERWNAFVPRPQALRAHCLAAAGRCSEARDDAESAFALACQLGDPCWEGMAGRALALLAPQAGDPAAAGKWISDARRRCNRLPDRYVWVSGFVALGHLEIAASQQHELVMRLARRLCQDGLPADLPEFIAWALIYQAEAGDLANLPLARTLAAGIVNPALQARVTALEDSHTSESRWTHGPPVVGSSPTETPQDTTAPSAAPVETLFAAPRPDAVDHQS